jgi:hypothetical protein
MAGPPACPALVLFVSFGRCLFDQGRWISKRILGGGAWGVSLKVVAALVQVVRRIFCGE